MTSTQYFRSPADALQFLQDQSVCGVRSGRELSVEQTLVGARAKSRQSLRAGTEAYFRLLVEAIETVEEHKDDRSILPRWFAWCFSHGKMHNFIGPAWCTADWMPLLAKDEKDAFAEKQRVWGEAVFLHHLPEQLQLIVHAAHR